MRDEEPCPYCEEERALGFFRCSHCDRSLVDELQITGEDWVDEWLESPERERSGSE